MSTQELFELVVARTKEVLPQLDGHAFKRTDAWADLGANSVDRAEIVTLIIESLDVRLSRIELFGPRNVGEMADLLHAKCAAR